MGVALAQEQHHRDIPGPAGCGDHYATPWVVVSCSSCCRPRTSRARPSALRLQHKRSACFCRSAIALGGSFRGKDAIASPGVRMSGTTNGTGVECIDSFELRQVPENGLQAPPGKPVLQLALADGPPLCSVQWGMQGGSPFRGEGLRDQAQSLQMPANLRRAQGLACSGAGACSSQGPGHRSQAGPLGDHRGQDRPAATISAGRRIGPGKGAIGVNRSQVGPSLPRGTWAFIAAIMKGLRKKKPALWPV